jgi:hypothetical protein
METTMTTETNPTKTEQIRALNDRLLQNFSEGSVVMTCGVAALKSKEASSLCALIVILDFDAGVHHGPIMTSPDKREQREQRFYRYLEAYG